MQVYNGIDRHFVRMDQRLNPVRHRVNRSTTDNPPTSSSATPIKVGTGRGFRRSSPHDPGSQR